MLWKEESHRKSPYFNNKIASCAEIESAFILQISHIKTLFTGVRG